MFNIKLWPQLRALFGFLATICFITMLWLPSAKSASLSCDITISADDKMQYSLNEIKIPLTCEKFFVYFKNDSKYLKHNFLISLEEDIKLLAEDIDKNYMPNNKKKVLFGTELINPNSQITLVIDSSKFIKDKTYIFWCSFPGHYLKMRGKIILIP